MKPLKSAMKHAWFIPLMALLISGVVMASALIISNTVWFNTEVDPPELTLGEISKLNGTTFPGGDRPDLVDSDVGVGITYDFACLLTTTCDMENVTLNITIRKSGGSLAYGDASLQVCDYGASLDVQNWVWRDVPLRTRDGALIGVCAPSWGASISADGGNDLNSAFRITYQVSGDLSIFLTASNAGFPPLSLLEVIQDRGQMIVGTQVPYPPFENINTTTDELEGIDIDIMHYIGQKLGVEIAYTTMDFDPLFAAVQTGQIDCAISSITITSTRDEVNDFTIPYYVANQAVLVKDPSTIADLDDLNASYIVTQTGTTGQWWVDDNLSPISHTTLSDVPAAALSVDNGLYDAFLTDVYVASQYVNDTNFNLKVAFVIYTLESYSILIPEGEPELKAAMDSAILEMIADGTLEEIILKWMI